MRTLLRFASLVLLYIILGLCFCSSAFGEEGNFIIPKNTLRIEDEAFRDCTEMTSVTVGNAMRRKFVGRATAHTRDSR